MASESSNANLADRVDDYYFYLITDEGVKLLPITDLKYAVELQLQEVINSSNIRIMIPLPPSHDAAHFLLNQGVELLQMSDMTSAAELQLQEAMSDMTYAAVLQLQEVMSSDIRIMFSRPPSHDAAAVNIIGECSSASSSSSSRSGIAEEFFCKICMDAVPRSEEHRASRGCAHAFCAACLTYYIGAKIHDRIADVKCPEEGCVAVLDPALCQGILPRDDFERWGASLCESMVLGAKKAYCPFKDCLAMMVMEHGDVAESECPSCKGHFCAQCGVPWHAGSDCAAYRKLGKGKGDKGKDDMMLLEMAKEKKWKRCPGCKQMVEKVDGCSHITCRCGYEFCYGCSVKWERAHICG